ncbi:F-box/LRR-repeat protein at3g59200 [Phtheirospermum japonicum]|uniref:F-box/LRR-repeat protein at3g59200 n=1 Tax=Phtheirospermum japonicum TaxID=374723 RepID=A0A830B513_9LAMI|nr:F-box/LRR-repeat protein at3g59200 [Phtheirospermum japonicum]
MGGEVELLEPLIQRIQYFLAGKEAARTTVLSKSWRSAWLTRPNLDFDETNFKISWWGSDEFVEFTNTTIRRYEESGIRIESFKLCLEHEYRPRVDHANELILRALKIGATHLSFNLTPNFVLPHEVFGAENLVELSVERCKVDLGPMDQKVIRCSRLKSLCLDYVDIETDVISNLISNCPFIEKLSLSDVGSVGKLGTINLHRLTCLELYSVEFNTLFLADLSSNFPSLKDLTLHSYTFFQEEVRISSCSLVRLDFRHESDVGRDIKSRIIFDVPSIRKFTFEGRTIPSLSFRSNSRDQWESHISITHFHGPTTFWFRKLNKFLTKLRRSKIHLSLKVSSPKSFDYAPEGLTKKQEVENLTVDYSGLPSLTCYALFDGVFRICRPKCITQYLVPKPSYDRWKRNNDFLCKIFIRGMDGEFLSTPINFMNGLHDLEEVNAQLYDEVVAAWRPIPLELLLDASKSPANKQTIRFQMKWKTID